MNTSQSSARLDRIRHMRGAAACRGFFRALARRDPREAARLLGDKRLAFGTLFLLRPDIDAFLPEKLLSYRDQTALRFCLKCSEACRKEADEKYTRPGTGEDARPVLLWIFTTGAADDGLCEEFDRVLDLAAAALIRLYREESILPAAAALIFRRRRRGSCLHDLIWAYFQAHSTAALRMIAEYLRSHDPKDTELARSLLHLPENETDNRRAYRAYLAWLKENDPYLYFTEESYQLTSAPVPCGVDLNAKFLCRKISRQSRSPASPLAPEETERLNAFRSAGAEEKEALARYSASLHRQNPNQWKKWMRSHGHGGKERV